MLCARCQTANPDTSRFCGECGEPFHTASQRKPSQAIQPSTPSQGPPSSGERTQISHRGATGRPGAGDSMAATTAGTSPGSAGARLGILSRGHLLGNRYEIEEPLGMGGMGMVYRARDRELDVPVAIKIIRAEYMDNERILERFKQEINIARRVTHRNVARIYDMGESEGLRYISMEYIEGRDLAHVMKDRGPFPVVEAISILRQICAALKEAHAVGVVHRDLKPHNIMLDAAGSAHVMDFGIAMSADARGMTRTGALIGTPEYMSPEQAEGRRVDHRSDIYSLGITLYELLSGQAPFKGESTWEVIKKHVEQSANSIRKIRRDVPEWLDTVILKCLEKDPALRYQSVGEIVADLDRQEAHLSARHYLPSRRVLTLSAAALVLVSLAVSLTLWMRPRVPVAGAGGRRSVAILPFENQTGRVELDWLKTGLADNLTTDLAESRYFRVLSRERLTQIYQELRLDDDGPITAAALQRIGEYGAVEAVVTGSFLSAGDQIRVNLKVQDPATGEIYKSKVVNALESDLLAMIDELTRSTKEMFELAPDRLADDADLQIASARTGLVEAASLFQKGVDLLYQGRNLEALGPLEAAVEADASFAMAHARLAEAHMRTGRDLEASEASQRALDLMLAQPEKIPKADRTFIQALHGRINNQPEESTRAYEELLRTSPGDPFIEFSLGEVLERTGDFAGAERRYRDAIDHEPKNPVLRFSLGRVLIRSGSPEEALAELQTARELYTRMGSEEGEGNALNALAVAFEGTGRYREALESYGRSETIKRRIGDKRGLAATLGNKAYLHQIQGELAEATRITGEALALTREIGDSDLTAGVLENLGSLKEEAGDPEAMLNDYREALEIRRTLKDRSSQVTCLLSLSRAEAALGRLAAASALLEESQRIADEIDDQEGLAQVASEKAQIDFFEGSLKSAIEGQERAIELWRNAGREDGVAEARLRLGVVLELQGRYAESRRAVEASLQTYKQVGDRSNEARANLILAQVALSLGDAHNAARLIESLKAPLAALGNPILLAQAGHLGALASLEQGDSAAARAASGNACRAAERTRAVQPAIRCGLASAATADPEEAAAQALAASTRAKDSGLAAFKAEADAALAQALERAGRADRAAAAALDALDASRRMGLPKVMLRAAPVAARTAWSAGRKDDAVARLKELFDSLGRLEAAMDEGAVRGFRATLEVRSAARQLGEYLQATGRSVEAAAWLNRAGS